MLEEPFWKQSVRVAGTRQRNRMNEPVGAPLCWRVLQLERFLPHRNIDGVHEAKLAASVHQSIPKTFVNETHIPLPAFRTEIFLVGQGVCTGFPTYVPGEYWSSY